VVASATPADAPGVPMARPGRRRFRFTWFGLVPFGIFSTLFLLIPTAYLAIGSLLDAQGNVTLDNYRGLSDPVTVDAYVTSIQISAVTAIAGGLFGFLVAYAVIGGGLPGRFRGGLMTFSGVASNFAGVPLAFAFIASLGRTGLMTILLIKYFDFNIYSTGFNLLSFWGLTLTYLYFQIPLMVLIMTPALDGLKREWREASAILGASSFQYWRYIALPVLWPSLLGTTLLLFANAFGAVATAYGLTGSQLNIVTILLYAQIRGDVLHDQNLGYALAFGMILVTGLSNAGYIWLRSRSERWLR
jgi:putative spermidine/putrescine transport system permease protein